VDEPKITDNGSADDDDREWEEDRREWNNSFESKKQKILDAPAVRLNLAVLERAGASPDKILTLLALSVNEGQETLRALIENKQRLFNSLADELKRISTEIETAFSDPFNFSGAFEALLVPYSEDRFMNKERLAKVSSAARQRIKPILALLQSEARTLGRLRKNLGRIRTVVYMGRFVQYVKESTGNFHDEEIANLLQSAHDALGVEATFSAESLRVTRRRLLPHLIKKRAQYGLAALYKNLPLEEKPSRMGLSPPEELDKTEGEN
jgi:hypothetical protein